MSQNDKTETKQKIALLKNFNERLNTIKKEDIEKQLQWFEWLTQLVEDQLKQRETSHPALRRRGDLAATSLCTSQ